MTNTVSIAALNIGSAAADRARRLVDEWITQTESDVFVLTETSQGPGTKLIVSEFRAGGWSVYSGSTAGSDRGTLIATHLQAKERRDLYPSEDPAPGRAIIIDLECEPALQIIGMYVPNRGNDPTKLDRKRKYLDVWLRYLQARTRDRNTILLGDLNVVPVGERPKFLPQMQFEDDWYSRISGTVGLYDAVQRHSTAGHEPTWVAFTGEGFTYDHILADDRLERSIVRVAYDHETRSRRGCTDHSALWITLRATAVTTTEEPRMSIPQQEKLF